MHPYGGEMDYRASLQVLKLNGQAGYDAAVEFDRNASNKPANKLFDLVFETIECRDKLTGGIKKYTVIDHGTSVLKGDYYVLRDDEGREEQVTAQKLSEMNILNFHLHP